MTNLLPSPSLQLSDANGVPLAGGKLEFFVVGTLTHKNTWQDENQTILNSNPVVLDSAGRCLLWGNGDYRAILKDALGNTIFDRETSASLQDSAVSPFMLSLLGATTSSQFLDLSGTNAAINTAVSNVSLIRGPTGPVGATGPASTAPGPTGPTGPVGPAAPGGTASQGFFYAGVGISDALGFLTVVYNTPFPNGTVSVLPYSLNGLPPWVQHSADPTGIDFSQSQFSAQTNSGFTWRVFAGDGVPMANTTFGFIAIGF